MPDEESQCLLYSKVATHPKFTISLHILVDERDRLEKPVVTAGTVDMF